VPVSLPLAAEMAGLLVYFHLGVNIGLLNEMEVVADRVGIGSCEGVDAAVLIRSRLCAAFR
jgi:UDP-N-acetyl-D-mannosaminuronate dehydrogenase